MWEWATNHSADQVGVNSSTWYQITTLESQALMPIADSELTMSLDGTKPGKEDPSPPYREARGIRWLFPKPPKLYAPPYRWDGWGTVDWVAEGSPYSRQWREQPLCAYLVWANDHHQVTHMPAMDKLQGIAMVHTPMAEPQGWIWHPARHL